MPTIELKPFERTDFDRLIGWIPSADFMLQWSGPQFTYPLTAAQLEEYIYTAEISPPLRYIYKAIDTASGAVVGHIELSMVGSGSGTVARVLVGDPANRGRGFGRQMVGRAVEIAFGTLKLERLYLSVFEYNRAALACYKRLGFRVDRAPWRTYKVAGRDRVTYRMCLLRSDWESSARQV